MKVKATQKGFYADLLRRPGATFAIAGPQEFSHEWMENIDPDVPTPEPRPRPRAAIFEAQEDAIARRVIARLAAVLPPETATPAPAAESVPAKSGKKAAPAALTPEQQAHVQAQQQATPPPSPTG